MDLKNQGRWKQINFFDFIDAIFDCGHFNSVLTLCYDPERHENLKKWQRFLEETEPESCGVLWYKTPHDVCACIEKWVKQTQKRRRTFLPQLGDYYIRDYLYVEEFRDDGELRFHMLVRATDARQTQNQIRAWRNISGGWAWERPYDWRDEGRVKGFLGHMVMRAERVLTVHCSECIERFDATDFIPWEPKYTRNRFKI